MSNIYHDHLNKVGVRLTAENLLIVMRIRVGGLLSRMRPYTSESASQSLCAKQLLGFDPRAKVLTGAERQLLQDFLAVHRTVWILEGRSGSLHSSA